MILLFLKQLISLLTSPSRMLGRSWLAELCMRATRELFVKGQKRSLLEFRASLDNSVGYHPALAKVSIQQRHLEGVPCSMVIPISGMKSKKVIVYFHGGGYTVGSAKSHRTILAQLAVDTQCLVICPDYRLAPEHRFPAAQIDCLTVARLVLNTHSDKEVILAGDSAGGALAISTALQLANIDIKQPDKLVLLSPWVNPLAATGSMISNDKNDFLSSDFLESSMSVLMQGQSLTHSCINFLNTPLSSMPKTLVQCGTGEIFHDQISEFCERAKLEGVELEFQVYGTQFHVFQLFSAVLKDAKIALKRVSGFILESK